MLTISLAIETDLNPYNHLHTPYRPHTPHRHDEVLPHVNDQRQLHRLGLLVLLALLFIPLGYIVREINEANAMNILQILVVFVMEAVRIFP